MRRVSGCRTRQFVTAFVFRMTGVPFNPLPLDLVLAQGGIKPFPEIDVLDRFLIGSLPAAFFPVMDPLGNSLTNVLAVGT